MQQKYNLLDDFGATQKPPTSYQLGCNILFFMSLPGSKRTLCLTLASISCFRVMPRSSRQKRHIMNSSQLLRSQCRSLNRHPCLWSAILVMESTWHAAWCTGEMSFQRMWMLLWLPSRPSELSNSWTGHRQVSWNQKDACSVCLIALLLNNNMQIVPSLL